MNSSNLSIWHFLNLLTCLRQCLEVFHNYENLYLFYLPRSHYVFRTRLLIFEYFKMLFVGLLKSIQSMVNKIQA